MSTTFDLHQFARRLRLFREASGMTMRELAHRVAISYSYMRSLEAGIRRPSTELLSRFASVLEVQTDDLYGLTNEQATALRIRERGNLRPLEGKVQPAKRARFVRIIGRVPADSLRFSLIEEEDADVPLVEVRPTDLAGARAPYALEVSGDCLRSLGIYSGDIVICDRPMGRTPRSGDLVVVRVGEEFTLKRWIVTGPKMIELRDGDGNLAVRLTDGTDYEVVGLMLTFIPAPR